jgi:hypothetical protein
MECDDRIVTLRANGMSVVRLGSAAVTAALAMLIMGSAQARTPGPATEATAGAAEQASPWGWLKMPKLTMPKVEMPKMPADPLAPLKNSARKIGDGFRKAGEGTKELFAGGSKNDPNSPRTPDDSPSLWQRMFGPKEEERVTSKNPMAEFMAQKRPE